MENFIKAKETFIESLNEYKSKLKDNPKDNEIAIMIEQCKVAANNVHEGEVITLGLVMVSSYFQLNLMQSKPIPKFPKGGIIVKGGIAEPILDTTEKVINHNSLKKTERIKDLDTFCEKFNKGLSDFVDKQNKIPAFSISNEEIIKKYK